MNNHPTIDLLTKPSAVCLNPVWNCVEFCFKANDYVLVAARKAAFLFNPGATPIADGTTVIFAGRTFITATPSGLGSFSWQGTNSQVIAEILKMFTEDYFMGANFVFYETFGSIFLQALEAKEFPNWLMSIPPTSLSSLDQGGKDLVLRKNYRLVIEVWETDKYGALLGIVTTRGYEPNTKDSKLCIDISKALRPLTQTTFPGLNATASISEDIEGLKHFSLRYGEIYGETSSSCEATPQFFERSSHYPIINAALQKDGGNMQPFCYSFMGNEATRFLTNRPNYTEICKDSLAWLWFYIDDAVLVELARMQNDEAPGSYIASELVITYTNGSDVRYSTSILPNSALGDKKGLYYIPSGLPQVGFAADPTLTVSSYEIYVGFMNSTTGLVRPSITERFTYIIADNGFCCCKEEFYFLNELGGFDTILFNCLQESDLMLSGTEFISYEQCGGDLLKGGKQALDTTSYEVFKVTTRFLNNYNSINWFREFLKSPRRLWKREEKVYKILLLNEQVELRRKEGFVFVTLEFILSYDLNTQQL